MDRRRFLTMTGIGAAGTVAAGTMSLASPAAAETRTARPRTLSGSDLTGWEVALGDARFEANGQAPVSLADIRTTNLATCSRLEANVDHRGIMAPNVTFKRIIEASSLDVVHVARYSFRLPYLPSTSNVEENGQTIEGGLFVWDGLTSRLDHGVAFQWVLNPWVPMFGDVRCWSSAGAVPGWISSSHLAVDTTWHTISLRLDVRRKLASITLDGHSIPATFTSTPKTGWGSEIAARLQAEVISLWPGQSQTAPAHRAEVRDWSWSRHASTEESDA